MSNVPNDVLSRTSDPSPYSPPGAIRTAPPHPPMPDHWKSHFEGNRFYTIFPEIIFRVLCLLAVGSYSLEMLWSRIWDAENKPEEFTAFKDRMIAKISTITLVVSRRSFRYHLVKSSARTYSGWIAFEC